MSKYDVGGSQAAYQPGSNDTVLANKLGITSAGDMDDAELELLEKLYEHVLNEALPEGAITTEHLKTWHRWWLSPIYEWAGDERSVNMGKGGFEFAAAAQIPRLLTELDKNALVRYTPCQRMQDEALIEAIATVHVEFILVHPFREGNGRLARLLADVMAAQAGYEPLNYEPWDENKEDYFRAIHAGMGCDYDPMMGWVECAFNE
jgi:cell filamentation protein